MSIKFTQDWYKEMQFGTYKWDDPQLFGSYLNPRVSNFSELIFNIKGLESYWI